MSNSGDSPPGHARLRRMRTARSLLSLTPCCLFACVLAFLPTTSTAATTAYMSSTEQLDLRQVQLVVVAPAHLQDALRNRALTLFTEAGLPLPSSHPSQPPLSAVLTLAFVPTPIDDCCPGKVLYAPSLTLTELVTIPRTGATVRDTTWLFAPDKEVRGPVDDEQIKTDADRFIHQFVTDYQTANRPPRNRQTTPQGAREQHGSRDSEISPRTNASGSRTIHMVSLSVLAAQGSSVLKASAARQLTEAGFHLATQASHNDAVSLGIEFTQQVLGDRCPGKVLYERGLYLVEEVHVTRRPAVTLWSDTWSKESVRIVPPLSLSELEADQRSLVQQFLQSHEPR